MDDFMTQQVEALAVANEYSKKLLNGIKNVSAELTGTRLVDTDQYLQEIINGLNWVIEVVNRTKEAQEEKGISFDKDEVNVVIRELGEALRAKDDLRIEAVLSGGVKEFIEKVEVATQQFATLA